MWKWDWTGGLAQLAGGSHGKLTWHGSSHGQQAMPDGGKVGQRRPKLDKRSWQSNTAQGLHCVELKAKIHKSTTIEVSQNLQWIHG